MTTAYYCPQCRQPVVHDEPCPRCISIAAWPEPKAESPTMRHELKTWPEYFDAVWKRDKTFEVRRDDRGFAMGDVLVLREWDPETSDYTGSFCARRVTYLLRGGQFGIEAGYVVMGLGEFREGRTVRDYRVAR